MATKEEVQAKRETVETLRLVLAAETMAQSQHARDGENDIAIARLAQEEAALLAQIEQARGVNQQAGIEPTPEFVAALKGEPLPVVDSSHDPVVVIETPQVPVVGDPNEREGVPNTEDGVVVADDVDVSHLPPPPVDPDVLGNDNDGVTPPTDPEPGDVPPELPHR